MKRLSMLCAIVLLFGAGSALAQPPTYQFAEAGTKNFVSETTIAPGEQISLDLYLSNVGAPQYVGGAWIDFTASTTRISYVSGGRCLNDSSEGCTGPWQETAGAFVNEPDGAGTAVYAVGNLDGSAPDVDGDLIVGTLTLECIAEGDVIVDLTLIPGVITWTPINDSDVVPGSLLIHQGGAPECDVNNNLCDDGIGCTDNICDAGTCVYPPNDSICDDGAFCNGDEFCDAVNDCSSTGNPCVPPDVCNEGSDECLSGDSDGDGILDGSDNCRETFNPGQEDTYPPQGNNIGDACDCECDFDCDSDVDADDVETFLADFGRFQFNNPCANDDPCNGDSDCDTDVDADDVEKFLEDFGRFQFNNPCPPCELGDWCVYEPDDDNDGIPDAEDNCPNTPNPNQEDTYPPQGNNIGDACDCECDFDCSGSVDASDVTAFLIDFGRSTFNNPCTNTDPCNGDVDCTVNVDAADVDKFLEDFGRSQFNNPCPPCVVGDWCVYQ